jgi:HlyD family secretion protein
VDEDEAKLETARLGGRIDSVSAARSAARASADAEARAKWAVDQKAQASPCAALVYDTLYREGEFVPAGSPVVSLLPPPNIKARFFVPEAAFAAIKAGDTVSVLAGGGRAPLAARVTYLSPQPEYTPPVLYNRDNREKLVYMVEASFAPEAAADLHPGQPVDVEIGAR